MYENFSTDFRTEIDFRTLGAKSAIRNPNFRNPEKNAEAERAQNVQFFSAPSQKDIIDF